MPRKLIAVFVFAVAVTVSACSDSALITGPGFPDAEPAAVTTFDPETGEGWVGKGEVQTAFGWNNKQLQDNAHLIEFRVNSVLETTWSCSKPHPQQDRDIVQLRASVTGLQGLMQGVARDNSKGKDGPVTGFYLLGFDGDPTVIEEGDEIGSCPAEQSDFTFDNNIVQTDLGGGMQVSIDGENWLDL